MKQPGLCTACAEPVFEIAARYPDGHELAGEVRSVGEPLDEARRVYLAVMSGRTVAITLCEVCADNLSPRDLPWLWDECNRANAREWQMDYRDAIGAGPPPEGGEKLALEIVHDLPILVLAVTTWARELQRSV